MSGVLQFIWHYIIDVVDNGVTFLAHPVYSVCWQISAQWSVWTVIDGQWVCGTISANSFAADARLSPACWLSSGSWDGRPDICIRHADHDRHALPTLLLCAAISRRWLTGMWCFTSSGRRWSPHRLRSSKLKTSTNERTQNTILRWSFFVSAFLCPSPKTCRIFPGIFAWYMARIWTSCQLVKTHFGIEMYSRLLAIHSVRKTTHRHNIDTQMYYVAM